MSAPAARFAGRAAGVKPKPTSVSFRLKLVAPAPARVGVRLDLALDVRLARVGMTALIRGGDAQPIAHAVVEDLAEGIARARIVKTFQPATTIATSVRIDLSHAKLE